MRPAKCPFCKNTLSVESDIVIQRVTNVREVHMMSCKYCDSVLGFM